MSEVREVFQRRVAEAATCAGDLGTLRILTDHAHAVVSALERVVEQSEGDERLLELLEEGFEDALALVGALGRHAARLGATPSSQCAVVPGVVEALAHRDVVLSEKAVRIVEAVCWEGYVAGVREVSKEETRGLLVGARSPVELVPRLVLWTLSGTIEDEEASEAVEELGRYLFHVDAAALLVLLRDVALLEDSVAGHLVAADVAARLLGARCIFVGLDDQVICAARRRGTMVDLLEHAETAEAALERLLPEVGRTLRNTTWIPDLLRAKRQ